MIKISESVEQSIKYGIKTGKINTDRDSAVIGMLRYMADILDNDNGDTPALRYVTPASFLSYCEKLGLAPDLGDNDSDRKIIPAPTHTIVGNSKWKRRA